MPFEPDTHRVQANREHQCQENWPDDVGDGPGPGQRNREGSGAHQHREGERPGARVGVAGRVSALFI
jgi:hypothetical protein